MKKYIHKFFHNVFVIMGVKSEAGTSALEYGILAGLIGCAVAVGATYVGQRIHDVFFQVGSYLHCNYC